MEDISGNKTFIIYIRDPERNDFLAHFYLVTGTSSSMVTVSPMEPPALPIP